MRLTPVVSIWSQIRSTHTGACPCVTRTHPCTCARTRTRRRYLIVICPQHAHSLPLHPHSHSNLENTSLTTHHSSLITRHLLRERGLIELHHNWHSNARRFSHNPRTCTNRRVGGGGGGGSMLQVAEGCRSGGSCNSGGGGGASPGLQTTTSASCMNIGTLVVKAKEEAL